MPKSSSLMASASVRSCSASAGAAELLRELSEVEERGGELPLESGIAARHEYRRAKGFGGGGLVPLAQCGARCIELLGEQRSHVNHLSHRTVVLRPHASGSGDAKTSSAPLNGQTQRRVAMIPRCPGRDSASRGSRH